jgi:multidrug resistance protein, MATE family
MLVLWFFCSPVLLLLGQQELLSNSVQQFMRVLIFGAPAYVGFESVKKYLQCQGEYNSRCDPLFPVEFDVVIKE